MDKRHITESCFLNLPLITDTNEHVPGQAYRIRGIDNRFFVFEGQTEKGSYWSEIETYFIYF